MKVPAGHSVQRASYDRVAPAPQSSHSKFTGQTEICMSINHVRKQHIFVTQAGTPALFPFSLQYRDAQYTSNNICRCLADCLQLTGQTYQDVSLLAATRAQCPRTVVQVLRGVHNCFGPLPALPYDPGMQGDPLHAVTPARGQWVRPGQHQRSRSVSGQIAVWAAHMYVLLSRLSKSHATACDVPEHQKTLLCIMLVPACVQTILLRVSQNILCRNLF
jgi:hypothetical protein